MKPKSGWSTAQVMISCVLGFLGMSGAVIGYFVAQANDRRDIKEVSEAVEDLTAENKEQAQAIDKTEVQYQLIQQQLGVLVEGMKDLKGKR